jgi:hypothetical protein
MAACLGAGVNAGGANNGWTTAPCATGGTSSGNYAGAATNAAAAILGGVGNIIQGAQECPALARYNADAHNVDEQHHALWARVFGDVNYAWQFNKQDCAKIRQISQIEIPLRTRSAALQKAAETQCSSVTWSSDASAQKFIADFEEANRRCLGVLKSAPETKASVDQPASQQQQPSASDQCISYESAHASVRTLESNGWQTNYVIHVRATHKPGCPKEPHITWTEPDGKPNNAYVTGGYMVQTAGGPATGIHVVP